MKSEEMVVKSTHLAAPLAAAAVLALAACGGGGSGPSVSEPVMDQIEEPIDDQIEPILEPYETISVMVQSEAGNPSAGAVVSYLASHASGGPWYAGPEYSWQSEPGLLRFDATPTLHMAEGTDRYQRAMTLYAVALVNRVLPYDQHILVGEDVPALTALEDIPDGQIFVDFAPSESWNLPVRGRPGAAALAEIGEIQEYDEARGEWERNGLRAGHVWMDLESQELFGGDSETLSILVHEILHTLGLYGHPPKNEFSDSMMRDLDLLLTDHGVPRIDGTALRVLYTRLSQTTEPEELSVNSLGEWERGSTNLIGAIDTGGGDLSFGVRYRNGVSVPWTVGAWPDIALSDNQTLRGDATWKGGLLGFTPDQRSVGGNAEIAVNLTTLNGTADFSDLQSWPAGRTPGAFGTGTQWNTGTLGYTIAVGGNIFHSTGGDDGTLSGRFYGGGHEGVAGSLEREDLTAAFGGRR